MWCERRFSGRGTVLYLYYSYSTVKYGMYVPLSSTTAVVQLTYSRQEDEEPIRTCFSPLLRALYEYRYTCLHPAGEIVSGSFIGNIEKAASQGSNEEYSDAHACRMCRE